MITQFEDVCKRNECILRTSQRALNYRKINIDSYTLGGFGGKRMKSMIALIIMLALFSVAFAAAEEIKLNPYIVSYHLNNSGFYAAKANNPIMGNVAQVEPQRWNRLDVYSFDIQGKDNTTCRVSILNYENSTDATLSTEISLQRLLYEFGGYQNVTEGVRKIDGKNGFLMVASNPRSPKISPVSFSAWYWLDKTDVQNALVSYGTQRIVVSGNLTAESLRNLLDTIHVKK
jgi:hypothetical protein